ncbi:Sushi domain-containing protein 4 [Varanus komodoensis]|nr:Sushi domain-containing protein 4 [Varanus komodoensis]
MFRTVPLVKKLTNFCNAIYNFLYEATDCLAPIVEDAEVYNKTYRTGDKLIISCHEGFQIRYPDIDNMVSVCQDDGSWDNLPICQGCLRPLVLPHSYINISEFDSSFPVGSIIYFQCFPGYKLEGTEFLECMYNLIWSDSPPRCLDVEARYTIPILHTLRNGIAQYYKYGKSKWRIKVIHYPRSILIRTSSAEDTGQILMPKLMFLGRKFEEQRQIVIMKDEVLKLIDKLEVNR